MNGLDPEDLYDVDYMHDYCPKCGLGWKEHVKDIDDEYICNEAIIIEKDKPRFYTTDLHNYTSDFLIEIIQWMSKKIEHLEEKKNG